MDSLTRRSSRREQRRVLLVSLVLGVLLQPVAWTAWHGLLFLYPRSPSDWKGAIAIDVVVEEPEKPAPEMPDGPVVDIEPPTFEETPDDAKYVAAYDANPAKEMKPSLSPSVEVTGRPSPPPAPAVKKSARRADRPGDTKRVDRPDERPDRKEGEPADSAEEVAPPVVTVEPAPYLLPDLSTSGIAVDDYLPDVPEGPGKLIRAKRYVYAVFFNRLARDVKRYWHADREYLRHDPSGEVYGIEDRYTQIYVKLSREGKIVDLAVAVSSDLDFLDAEALAALRAAAPFHHPPKALADEDGYIRFFFGFYLEVNGSPRVRVFRY